jgi:hypothetical protein
MGISGCTSCQQGGAEALKAYDQNFQVRRDDEARQNAKAVDTQQASSAQASLENRPIAGAVVGSNINISA